MKFRFLIASQQLKNLLFDSYDRNMRAADVEEQDSVSMSLFGFVLNDASTQLWCQTYKTLEKYDTRSAPDSASESSRISLTSFSLS